MPFYNRYWISRWRKRRPPWRRRLTYRRRRPRQAFRRTLRRRYRVRNYRLRYKKKKLKKIRLNQWQPKVIRKSSLKGSLPLFACGKSRIGHNFTLFKESIVPVGEPGGGSWSIMQLNLNCLFDDYSKFRGWWTVSNNGLPLVKYHGMKCTFYRSKYVDYVIVPQLCPPFSVTRDMYLNIHPSRMLMNHKKIIVTRKSSKNKPYKKKWFRPPDLLKTGWYFQQDICRHPLILLHIAACDFEQPYIPENQISDNYTFYSLNTDMFRNNQFADLPTGGYYPKTYGTQNYTLYTTGNGHTPTKWSHVIPLKNTETYTAGVLTNSYEEFIQKKNWGNPFYHNHSHPDVPIYYYNKEPTKQNWTEPQTFTELSELFFQCRYNAYKDDGIGNVVFMKSNKIKQGEIDTLPDKEDITIQNYPLWLIFYSWLDWLEKLKPIQHILQDYYFVIISKYIEPKRKSYLLLDYYFVRPDNEKLNNRDRANWYPKTEMQEEVQYYFSESGPYTPKITRSQSIQANFEYNVKVKWGGCPAPMELMINPCQQEKFPIPNSVYKGNEIQNPETDKKAYLSEWDERQQTLTAPAAKRIKTATTIDDSFAGTTKTDPPVKTYTEAQDPSSEEEESETQLQNKLILLKRRNKQLLQQLFRMKPS
nr:MAG: ORF1 [TTV-like mini virus]